jgi:DNA repair exonuclease SbcCD ATPase subunit
MLNRLHIRNGYRHANSVFEFKTGQTAITGKNESGKSVTLEMILFALWGTVALRGAVEDYKKLEVTLEFVVREMMYRVVRTVKNAKLIRVLNDGEQDVATGTKPVNAKMKEIFGYDFDVFTMANACLQGQIEKLSDAKPAERKKIVDQTIGLTVLDDMVKEFNEKSLTFRRQAEGLASVLREPVQPAIPSGYESSTTLALKRTTTAELVAELHQLRGMVAHKPLKPVEPVCAITETAGTLQGLLDSRSTLITSKKTLEGMLAGQAAELNRKRAGLEKLDAERDGRSMLDMDLARITQQLAGLPMPEMQEAGINVVEAHWDMHERWVARQKLLGQGEHVCPKCDHHWPLASAALEAYADVTETPAPELTRQFLRNQRALLGNIERRAELEQAVTHTQGLIEAYRADLAQQIEALKLEIGQLAAEISDTEASVRTLAEAIENTPDRSADLKARQQFDGELLAYGAQLMSYEQFFEKLAAREARIAELASVEQTLSELDERLVVSRAYEQAHNAYEAAVKSWEADRAQHDGLVARADDYANAKAAIAEAKTVIKSFLIPSLNKVASLLMNQMTGGARSSIVVDDDFNITVDGQQVQTLSGSGKAVANLALRIGLGQVLTNGVFSVFMADEFDESMDEERACYTAECLQRLKETIRQVIVVTHKRPVADHVFSLPLMA